MSKAHYLAAAATTALAAAVVGLDGRRPPASDQSGYAAADGGDLDGQIDIVRRAIAARCELADELISGRRGLADVAARFRDLSAGRVVAGVVQLAYPGATPGERYCRQAIWYAQGALDGRPDRDRVLARLETELHQVVAAGGRLPGGSTMATSTGAGGGR